MCYQIKYFAKVSYFKVTLLYFFRFYVIWKKGAHQSAKFQLKTYREVMCHDTEEWRKIWKKKKKNLLLQKWQELGEFWPKHWKVSKTCTLIGSLCAKYITFDLKKYRGVIFHDTEEWFKIWRSTDLWFGKWHEELGKFSPEQLKVLKYGLWWDPLIQIRKCMSLKFSELHVMTMKNDAKFEEELTCCFKIDMNLTNFDPSNQKPQSLHFNGLLLTKV